MEAKRLGKRRNGLGMQQARKVNKMSVSGTWKILGAVVVMPILHLWWCVPAPGGLERV